MHWSSENSRGRTRILIQVGRGEGLGTHDGWSRDAEHSTCQHTPVYTLDRNTPKMKLREQSYWQQYGEKQKILRSSHCVQQDQKHLWSTGTQVQSPAQHSGLRIWCCHSCGVGCNCSLDLIPDLETPYAKRWPKKKKIYILLYSTGNYIQSLLIDHDGR